MAQSERDSPHRILADRRRVGWAGRLTLRKISSSCIDVLPTLKNGDSPITEITYRRNEQCLVPRRLITRRSFFGRARATGRTIFSARPHHRLVLSPRRRETKNSHRRLAGWTGKNRSCRHIAHLHSNIVLYSLHHCRPTHRNHHKHGDRLKFFFFYFAQSSRRKTVFVVHHGRICEHFSSQKPMNSRANARSSHSLSSLAENDDRSPIECFTLILDRCSTWQFVWNLSNLLTDNVDRPAEHRNVEDQRWNVG